MIPVRIAADLSPTGTEGVRWVLVDDAEAGLPRLAVEPSPASPPQEDVRPRRRAASRSIKLAVLLVGLAAASFVTHWIVGDDGPLPVRRSGQSTVPAAAR